MIAIHIGSPKAGSTTIQKFLGDNADALCQIGVDYPVIGRTNRGYHVNLYYDLRGHRNFRKKYGQISELVQSMKVTKSPLTILSAEEFQKCSAEEVAELRDDLRKVDEEFTIILIIRDLVDSMPSTYSQSVRGGQNLEDFDTFFASCVTRRGSVSMKAAEIWGEAFGWDRLRIRVLDPKFLVNGDLIDDFLTQVGIDPGECDLQRSETANVANASPGWRVLEAVRALYGGAHGLPTDHPLIRSFPHGKELRKLVGRMARQVGDETGWNADRGRYLTLAQAQHCIEVHGEAISALNQRLPQALSAPRDLASRDFFEREFMPEASRIPAQQLRDFYDAVASRVSLKRPTAESA